MRNHLLVAFFLISSFACQREVQTTTETTTITETGAEPQPLVLSEGFLTPESVLYDPDQDVYFVSNINVDPFAVDDNGYISRVNAESLQVEPRWIDGPRAEVTLNAPKGMAIVGDELWVTDITTIRKFDRRTGAVKGEIPIRGSGFLNDLAGSGAGAYVSDSGLKQGFVTSGTDAVYQISGNKATKVASGSDLNRPNGLAVAAGRVWVVSFGAKELYQLENGRKTNVTTLPTGGLDGLVALDDGTLLVSSWDGKAVYRGSPGGVFEAVVENIDAPADLGYDTKRRRVLIPHFNENRVTIHQLP